MIAKNHRQLGWIGVVLASGIGLVAVVAVDLWRTVREQDERAQLTATRDAERTARSLLSALLDPEILDLVDDRLVYSVEGATLDVPESIGWLSPPAPFDPDRDLDIVVRDRLVSADRQEGAEATRAWRDLRRDPTIRGAAAAWLSARTAWYAHRAGEPAWRDELLAELDEVASLDAAVSAALLHAAAHGAVPAWAPAELARLPGGRAEAVFARLEERGLDVAEMRAARDAVAEQRARLRRVAPHVPLFAASPGPVARAVDGDLLLFFPERGTGALLDGAAITGLIGALREAGLEWSGSIATGANVASESSTVVAGAVSVVPAETEAAGVVAGPTGLAILAVALAVLCGGGAFLALRAVRRESEATRLRSEFLTTVTHELKTPLAGIRLVAELLEDDHVTDEVERRAYLARLSGEAVRLSMLIENVLDLGRLERGERPHDPRREDVVALVRDTVRLFGPLSERSGVRVEMSSAASPVEVDVDRDTLRQSLLNVLDNARKYAGDGTRIEVAVEATLDRGAVIGVRDFGPGVQAEERTAIFERFRRGSVHRHGSVPGVGLGLHLARAILLRHGGDLVCVDPPGGGLGALFELRLPLLARRVEEEPAA